MVQHANAARDEIQHLADEFLVLARATEIPTPNIDRLYPHLVADAPLMPEGSRNLPLDWRQIHTIALSVLMGLVILAGWCIHRKNRQL